MTISEEKFNRLPYRPGVGLMIVNKDLKVFVGKRIDSRNESWQMPQGGIDPGEPFYDAVKREMFEEIGTNNGDILAETKEWYKYDIPMYLVPKLWDGKYRGQQQKWFLIEYKGTDEDINLSVNDHPEFMEWKWSKMEELSEIVVPFKKDLYINVIAEFIDIIIELKRRKNEKDL